MSDETVAEQGTRVFVVYRDSRKDMSAAEKFGQLRDMFSGKVRYDLIVGQARKMLHDYRDGDYILMVGDPALCSVVCAVALEFSEEESLRLLRWDRDEVDYRPLELGFGDGGNVSLDPDSSAEVQRRNRWA